MPRILSRWLPVITLMAWAAILLYITTGGRIGQGRIGDYLAPPFIPGALAAGIVLALMALALAASPQEASSDCCADDACSHALSRFTFGKLLTFLVLLLPIAVAPFASKSAFQALVQRNRMEVTDASALGQTARVRELKERAAAAPAASAAEPTSSPVFEPPLPTKDGAPAAPAAAPEASIADYLQRTPEGYIVAEVIDLLYASQDNLLRKDFEGKTVQIIAQLMPDSEGGGPASQRFKAARMFMSCCAADARPVATLVEAEKLPDLPEMTWVKVVGTATFPIENGRRTAVLKSQRVEQTEPPDESMLF